MTPRISDRLLEITHLLLDGLSEKEIAAKLSLSPATVKVHKRAIFITFHVRSHVELLVKQRDGEIDVPGWRSLKDAPTR
jgi:DNA-binding NarL/FixJ family response regulator